MLDSRAVRALLSLGMVVGLGATGTYAYWTDEAVITGTSITAGTIDLDLNNLDSISGYTQMNINNMVPGNSVAGAVTVNNNGTAPLNYHVDALADPDLKGLGAALLITVTDGTVNGEGTTAETCSGTVLATATGFKANMLGTAANPRLLPVNGSHQLCIQAKLPETANTSLQGATTNVKFTFKGTSF